MGKVSEHHKREKPAGKLGMEEFRVAVAQTILERFSLQEVRQKSIENLERWKSKGTWSIYYEEWMTLMSDGTDEDVIHAMTSPDDRASRLRGASPYPGLLDEDAIKNLRLMYRGK